MTERVERLTNLLALLLETSQPLSLVEIGGALSGQYPEGESARRGAFERDKAALRELGVPIEQEVVVGGPWAGSTRYRIDRARYELDDLQLEPDEMRALQVAVAATRSGSELGQEAMWKLGSGVVDTHAAVVATLPSVPGLALLREAVARRATVGFWYRDVDRTVEPYGLMLRDGFWYLHGLDRTRGERRTFRVDRIDGRITTGGGNEFARPDGLDLRAVLPDDPKLLGAAGDPPDAIVRVDASRAAAVVRELGRERVVATAPDGAVDVRVPCANPEAFRSWLLGLLDHAVVVAPADVRAEIVEWLERQVGR